MGHTMSGPISSKHITRETKFGITTASCEMQGYRKEQEDCHNVCLGLEGKSTTTYIGVYDGHAGHKCSAYLGKNMPAAIAKMSDPFDKKKLTQTVMGVDNAFIESQPSIADKDHGSTCIFAVMKERATEGGKRSWDVTVVNVGDSRVVLVHPDGEFESLSLDHKPEDPLERRRIYEAGGTVSDNRVDGGLAMSRAMGDYQYKCNPDIGVEEQKVIPVPDIMTSIITEGDVLIVCCDGIVEAMENCDVAAYVKDDWFDGKETDPAKTLCGIFEKSLKVGSKDNHTAVMAVFGAKDVKDVSETSDFVAGPYSQYKDDATFVTAYQKDAMKSGVEGDELMELITITETDSDMAIFEPSQSPQDMMQKMVGEQLSDPNLSSEQKQDVIKNLMESMGVQAPQESEEDKKARLLREKIDQLRREKINQLKSVTDVDSGVKHCASGCGKREINDVNLKSCSGCHQVSYCSVVCQRDHWKAHKKACKQHTADQKTEKKASDDGDDNGGDGKKKKRSSKKKKKGGNTSSV